MLCLSKKADYALVALAHMAERGGRVASAREIAGAYQLPLPLLMNILKNLQLHGVLESARGAKGGYRIRAEVLEPLSLFELVSILGCRGKKDDDCGCMEEAGPFALTLSHVVSKGAGDDSHSRRSEPMHAPAQALHYKLQRFLKEVKVSDLILPGRRIDVPLERLAVKTNPRLGREREQAAGVGTESFGY